MSDRRRINGPTYAPSLHPTYVPIASKITEALKRVRSRNPNQSRKIFLQTGLTPSASGSAYLELEPSTTSTTGLLSKPVPSLKLSCTVHGPKPLPRNAAFSPQLLLSAHVKYAPFASYTRRGFLRDDSERDLSSHVETALKAVVLGDRWPKSSAEVIITIIEGEAFHSSSDGDAAQMNALAGCITAASAALVEAGIDCIDLVSGGTAAVVRDEGNSEPNVVVDPDFEEHDQHGAMCGVGYLSSRNEIVELWQKGSAPIELEEALFDKAVAAAQGSRAVLAEVLRESALQAAANQKSMQQKEAMPGRDG